MNGTVSQCQNHRSEGGSSSKSKSLGSGSKDIPPIDSLQIDQTEEEVTTSAKKTFDEILDDIKERPSQATKYAMKMMRRIVNPREIENLFNLASSTKDMIKYIDPITVANRILMSQKNMFSLNGGISFHDTMIYKIALCRKQLVLPVSESSAGEGGDSETCSVPDQGRTYREELEDADPFLLDLMENEKYLEGLRNKTAALRTKTVFEVLPKDLLDT